MEVCLKCFMDLGNGCMKYHTPTSLPSGQKKIKGQKDTFQGWVSEKQATFSINKYAPVAKFRQNVDANMKKFLLVLLSTANFLTCLNIYLVHTQCNAIRLEK